MTEAEWLACEDPTAMLESLAGPGAEQVRLSDRKARLLMVAAWSHPGLARPDVLANAERMADDPNTRGILDLDGRLPDDEFYLYLWAPSTSRYYVNAGLAVSAARTAEALSARPTADRLTACDFLHEAAHSSFAAANAAAWASWQAAVRHVPQLGSKARLREWAEAHYEEHFPAELRGGWGDPMGDWWTYARYNPPGGFGLNETRAAWEPVWDAAWAAAWAGAWAGLSGPAAAPAMVFWTGEIEKAWDRAVVAAKDRAWECGPWRGSTDNMGLCVLDEFLSQRLPPEEAPPAAELARQAQRRRQADLIREVAGNPFRPVLFLPEWRTDTAIALARQMYESRDFSAMPILGDALQDAGCDSEDILSHCRGGGPHVRGCWVVDLVLGKE